MSVTVAQQKATTKYKSKNYDRILLLVRKDAEVNKQKIDQAAKEAGQSTNAYCLEAIKDRMNS